MPYQNPYFPQYQTQFQPQFGMNPQDRLAQMQQQLNNQMQAPIQQPTTQNVNWIPVSGYQGAKDHIVQPNTTAWMMDNNEPVFYVKSADNLGTTTFKAYRFEEIAEPGQTVSTPQIDMSKYVQRDEFESLKEQIDKLTASSQKSSTRANKEA